MLLGGLLQTIICALVGGLLTKYDLCLVIVYVRKGWFLDRDFI